MSSSEILEAVNRKKIREYFIRFGERVAVDRLRPSAIPDCRMPMYIIWIRNCRTYSSHRQWGGEGGSVFFRRTGFWDLLPC